MDFFSWIAVHFRRAPRSPRPGRPPRRRCPPTLELLEDRLSPATLTVNTLADSTGGAQLSLRDAILAVNSGSYSGPATGQVSGTFGSNDTILFQSGLNGTISLKTASGPLVISSNLTLTANPTLSAITISGQFAGSQTGVFEVTSAGTATVAGLTITQGKDATNLFGGIHVQSGGALTVNGCTFVNNQSMGPGGGAILNAGTLTVTNSTFNDNSGVVGGAIDNISGATATLINCTISGNQATSGSGTGGGVANAGSLTLLNTLIAQNTSAGTNPDVVGAFTSSGHNLIGNATGATGLTDGINGDQVGSAAPFTGDVTSGLATITNVSSTAGLAVGQLITTAVAGISAGTVIAALGTHSITLSQAATATLTGATFTSSVNANLGPLQNNGGGIQTMALLPTSSGIDAGANSDSVLTVPTVDQRGVSRPQAGTVDIGAVEANQLLVTNLNDSGAGSLRDALTQSNSIPGTVLIDFQAGLTGTISLTTARLEIIHDNWVRGPGASQITVDGNLQFWCFGVNSQYLSIGALHTAISGLTLTRGKQTQGISDGRGGAISYRNGFPNDYHLTVKDSVIENSGDDGIYAEDRLSVINCRIFNNTGHGININGDDLDVSNSWIAGNTQHGISSGVNTVVTNCTLSGNGENGIRNGDGNQLLTNCTVTGNNKGVEVSFEDIGLYTNCTIMGNVTEDARTVVGNSGGNMIFRNSIVGKMVVQFGIFTSQGNNIFVGGFPGTLQSSDVVCPVISSLSASSGGTLAGGKYYYVIGAVTATGTLTSLESSVTVGANSKATINWTAPVGISGVTGYQIFRGTTLGGETLIATVSAGATSFTDTGAAGSSSVPLLLGALANNGGPVPTLAPTVSGSVFTRNKANSAFAPLLDACGYLRNPLFPGIGAVESVSSTPNTVSLSPGTLVGIDQGLSYSQSITASGGTGTGYLIGITAGALPPGFTLTFDGTLAGTATTVGSFAFTVTGFDSAGNFGSKNYTLNVNPAPSITTSSLPIGTENNAYSKAILTSGGTAPFTWSYTGTLPSGITFDTGAGTFGGTPDTGTVGTYNNIQVTATDSYGHSATQTYSMTIHERPVLSIGTSAVAYTENAVPVLLSDAATVSDIDSANLTGGNLTVNLASGGSSADRLGIRNQGNAPGQVGVSSTTVMFGGVAVGAFTGGVGTTPLVVTFNASATPAAVEAVARNITFAVVSDNPTTTNREVQWTLTDGDGGASATVGQTVTVTAVNDPPSGWPGKYTTRMNTPLKVKPAKGLLRGAFDPDVGAVLTARLAGKVKVGVLKLKPNGSFTYIPRVGFQGVVKFRFTIDDGQGGSSGLITVKIQVL